MNRIVQLFLLLLYLSATELHASGNATTAITGRVIDKDSRMPVAYATVFVVGNSQWYAATDTLGYFKIEGVTPGIYSLSAVCQGYNDAVTPEYIISARTPFIEIVMSQNINLLEEVTVVSSALERSRDVGMGQQIIGIADIEKIAGGNRDISRVVRTYPGVSFSPIGYRNDLIVRGGAPSENLFYLDGIEIPNINHFSTQGASGGPVGIINADLIEQVKFYTAGFPVEWGGALSSVMDIRLKDGNFYGNNFKATLGASEFAFSGGGHIGKKTTWLFSLRRSYLQFLFKLLGLPFLPDYIDGQLKIKHRISQNDEITLIALAGIDDMELNTEEKGENVEYLLSYLPQIKQQTYTVGAAYRHYGNGNVLLVSLGYNFLYNKNLKYMGNDASSEDNLILKLRSTEQKATFRAEDRVDLGRWNLLFGIQGAYSNYWNNTYQRAYTTSEQRYNYATSLPTFTWGTFAWGNYLSKNKLLSIKMGVRFDGCNYSKNMQRFWESFSPRLQLGYMISHTWSVSAGGGIYYQLPPYTSLGYKIGDEYANKHLEYMRVMQMSAGVKWSREFGERSHIVISLEGFYKGYGNMPFSVQDGIPLACKGNDYGVVGNELLLSAAKGRSYGAELSVRWQIPGKLNFMTSATLFKSEYQRPDSQTPANDGEYIPSAWDNRFIANIVCTYNFGRNWSAGAKLSTIGGAPYTPYDADKSSLKEAWDVQGRPYIDYTLYNTERLKPFAQLDLRIDKSFYFKKWMLGVYVDVQNVTGSKLRQQDVLISTGIIENTAALVTEQRYIMKYIPQEAGSIVPAVGITVEF